MKAKYWQKGENLDYVNKTEAMIEFGDVVVLSNRIGVAGDDILPNESGVVHVTGVFSFEKSAREEITAGTEVFYTDSGIAKEGTVKAGYVTEDSSADSVKVFVKID